MHKQLSGQAMRSPEGMILTLLRQTCDEQRTFEPAPVGMAGVYRVDEWLTLECPIPPDQLPSLRALMKLLLIHSSMGTDMVRTITSSGKLGQSDSQVWDLDPGPTIGLNVVALLLRLT